MILFWLAAFASDGPRETLEDAQLARSMGDRDRARARLMTLTNDLAAADPVRGTALARLADLQIELGRTEAARETLRRCIAAGPNRAACVERISRLELEQNAVTSLPTVWDFRGEHGLVVVDAGSMEVVDDRLRWTVQRDPVRPGTLIFGVDLPKGQTPKHFEMVAGTLRVEAWLGIVLVDERGQIYASPTGVRRMQPGAPMRWRVALDQVRNAGGPLDPNTLERILIRDLSGVNDESLRTSELWLDDVTLR